ncbi:hypothetical protein LR48_Vigan55s000400 [Vigna angularis]|uniref:Uncharacterized protein n=1 Tax=Phaseolus angularis TaxID=3914 RepID=A0A0L9T3Q9_PHAAN|nr:hypothetical protein LR48_Vigan55s000400 [Vigna angularis]
MPQLHIPISPTLNPIIRIISNFLITLYSSFFFFISNISTFNRNPVSTSLTLNRHHSHTTKPVSCRYFKVGGGRVQVRQRCNPSLGCRGRIEEAVTRRSDRGGWFSGTVVGLAEMEKKGVDIVVVEKRCGVQLCFQHRISAERAYVQFCESKLDVRPNSARPNSGRPNVRPNSARPNSGRPNVRLNCRAFVSERTSAFVRLRWDARPNSVC